MGDRETVAEQRPFLALAELLGRFCVQLERDNVERVEVEVAGQVGAGATPSSSRARCSRGSSATSPRRR